VYRFQYARSSSPERQKKMVEQYLSLQEREESDASERVEQSLKLSAGQERDERFREIISKYPHTDAALRAMQELQGSDKN
jgi:methionine salvage enolase-phosphatase E1